MPKIIVQVERPTETSPCAVIEGDYMVGDGKVHVEDDRGRPIGNEELKAGDDPAVIARASCASTNRHAGLTPRYPIRGEV